MLKILPKGILGGAKGGDGRSYVLEKSVVDVKEGWMETESRNLEWTGILSVVERQRYTRSRGEKAREGGEETEKAGVGGLLGLAKGEKTEVSTTVIFESRFGQPKLLGRRKGEAGSASSESDEEAGAKRGFFSSWSTAALQRTIEAAGVQRTRTALVNGKEGMAVVLERLRTGGLVRAVEGMRRDRELVIGGGGPWKKVWQQGGGNDGDGESSGPI